MFVPKRNIFRLAAFPSNLLELARSLSPCLWNFSKKHVGPGAAVESTTGGSEKEAKPPVPLEVGYVARLPVMESKSCLIREKKKEKKIYITSSEAIAKLRLRILYRLCAV